MGLSRAQIERFDRDGFLVVEDVFDESDLGPLIRDFGALIDQIAAGLLASGQIVDGLDDLPFDRRLASLTWAAGESLQPLLSFPPAPRRAIYDFLTSEKLNDLVESLVGPEIRCHPTQHVRPKLPRWIGEVYRDYSYRAPIHQDAAALLPEADETLVVTTWIPLVDVSEDMGPLQVLPGCHHGPIGRHVHRPGEGLMLADEFVPSVEPVTIPLAKGGVLLLHGRTPHGSAPNDTQLVRWSLDLRWHDRAKPGGRPLPGLITRSRQVPTTGYDVWLADRAARDADRVPRIVDRWNQP